jgi:hypothetical protein
MHYQRHVKGLDMNHVGRLQRGSKPRIPTCHPDRPHGAKGLCNSCYTAKWIRENPTANSGAEWQRRNPDRHAVQKRRALLKRHGLSIEQYEEMWNCQQGKCANTNCSFTAPLKVANFRDQGLYVDHCHATNKVRGLLCRNCNTALGHTMDDRERLIGLIKYLEESN